MPTKADVLQELARRGVNIDGLGQSATASKPTEDQGKALTFGKLMTDAEGSYRKAVEDKYNPGDLRNTAASFFEGLPFGGLDGVGAVIRDDVSDRARQAELQWSDAQLKAVSGAASPEAEVKRNIKTFFPRPGENVTDISPQKQSAREQAFQSARIRSGPLSSQVGVYPGEPGSSVNNPLDLSRGQSRATAPVNAFYRDPQGRIRQNKNGDAGNPIVVNALARQVPKASSQPQRVGTMEEAMRLPPGTVFITPDGRQKVR